MLEVTEIVLYLALTTWMFFAILRFDEARLRPEQLARGWTRTSKLAVVGCGLLGVSFLFHLAVIVHFWRTRRSLYGIGLGVLCAAGMFAVGIGVLLLVEWIAESIGGG
jgi:hypothetical protein